MMLQQNQIVWDNAIITSVMAMQLNCGIYQLDGIMTNLIINQKRWDAVDSSTPLKHFLLMITHIFFLWLFHGC